MPTPAAQTALNNLAASVAKQYDAALAKLDLIAGQHQRGDTEGLSASVASVRDTVQNIRTAEESCRMLAGQGVVAQSVEPASAQEPVLRQDGKA